MSGAGHFISSVRSPPPHHIHRSVDLRTQPTTDVRKPPAFDNQSMPRNATPSTIELRRPQPLTRLRESTLGSVVAFFVIAYAFAWGLWVVLAGLAGSAGMATVDFVGHIEAGDFSVAGDSTPGWALYLLTRGIDFSLTIAGLIMIGVTRGRAGYRQLGRRLLRWRFRPFWYLVALSPLALYSIAAVLASANAGGSPNFDPATVQTILFSLSSGLLVSLFLRGAMGEEIGLRGFALTRLQEQMTPARASLIVGVGWALWHLPALLEADPGAAVVFVALVMGFSFTFTWIFNGSGGSLIPPLLFHATQNWEEGFEVMFPAITGTDWETLAAIGILLLSVVALVAVVRSGAERSEDVEVEKRFLLRDLRVRQ